MSNVITANFQWGRKTQTAPLYQYNKGMRLRFEHANLPAIYRVDFANSVYAKSKTVTGDENGVIIPYEYFVPGQTIYAWIVIDDETSRTTVYQVAIPVSPRAMPTDVAPDEEQQDVIDGLIAEFDAQIE